MSNNNQSETQFDCFNELPPADDKYDLQHRLNEDSDVRAIAAPKETPREYEPLVVLGDLEGNASALAKALIKAGYAEKVTYPNGKKRLAVTEVGKGRTVVQTGDIFDRGQYPLKTIARIQAMRDQGLNIVTVAGNHDIFNLQISSCPSVVNNDPRFYQFIEEATPYIKNFTSAEERMERIDQIVDSNQTEEGEQYLCDAHTYLVWRYTDPQIDDNNGLLNELKSKYFNDRQEEPSIREYLQKMHELFYGNEDGPGELQSYRDSIVPFYKSGPVMLFHAGLDKEWAAIIDRVGIDKATKFFQTNVQLGNLNHFFGPFTQFGKMFWVREGEILCPEAVAVLKKLGILVIIRGHDRQPGNLHSVTEIDGITVINNDVNLSHRNIAGVIVNNLGKIIGFNPADNEQIKELASLPTISQQVDTVINGKSSQVA